MALLLAACSFSPVSHRIKIGEEPFIVFTGEGIDNHTDLFAAAAGGTELSQVTFTALIERSPRLTQSGDVVAFLRMRDTMPATHREVVLMNLLSGGEFAIALPSMAGNPSALAWSPGDSLLIIRTDQGLWQAYAPPHAPDAAPVMPADSASADSALTLWLGQPRFARVVGCPGGGLCTVGPHGDTTALAPLGHDAIPWGSDSVAWFEANGLAIRSLGPGRERRLTWRNPPAHPRDGSYAPGPANSP
jgi:hypothetical protein